MRRDSKGRFVRGISGNPTGRPTAQLCLTALLREALAAKDPKAKRTRAEVFIQALIAKACDGDVRAAELLFDRVDGPVAKIVAETIDLEAVARAMQAARAAAATRSAGGDRKPTG